MKTLIELMGVKHAIIPSEYYSQYQEYRQKQLDALTPWTPPPDFDPTKRWKRYVYKRNDKLPDTIEIIRKSHIIDWY